MTENASTILEQWPDESRGAAQLVIDAYGEPHKGTDADIR